MMDLRTREFQRALIEPQWGHHTPPDKAQPETTTTERPLLLFSVLEVEVLQLLAAAKTIAEMAKALNRSEDTVRRRLKSIRGKLQNSSGRSYTDDQVVLFAKDYVKNEPPA
jgi:DNA-binding NarL/FixJ family response regulator